ncbi:MAG: 1-deoxy-D-xylulose-5-phosphate reductoisomerase [Fimbriimonadaceae bacterium]|nr:1-deoxy-D-xylulose-5-phosphate reductoisomerase [Fimbriimonadaceae bacterium]
MLGATGSIGVQTLDVIARHPDRLQVVGLAARSNGPKLHEQGAAHPGARLALFDESAATRYGLAGGMGALVDLVTSADVDLVVVSVAGVIGLAPTLAAIRAGKDIALASKEVLVAAGEVVMPLVREFGVNLTPIDSEHSAIFQCLRGYRPDQVSELILTASGGPFRGRTRESLRDVTVAQALAHPTWRMGGKITVDSATLMNKALETIEARWLFDVPIDRVRAVVHPQSIVHSMVRLADGSVLAQMGWPDMRLPIQIALLHPERVGGDWPVWNPTDSPTLTFEPIDEETFPALSLGRRAVAAGGTMPCAFNAANEEAANGFLAGRCGFLAIAEVVGGTMDLHRPMAPTLDNLLETDAWARHEARSRFVM